MGQEMDGGSSLYLCLVLGSSWQAQCLVPASGCLGWAPSAPSGVGRSGGGGWLGGPMQLGLCFSALVVLAGVLCGSFCSTSAPAGSFQSLCCYGGSGMSHLFSVRPWLMSCGLLPVHFVILHAGALWLDLDVHCCGCLGSLSSWGILSPP